MIEIYGKPGCGYCDQAKQLLEQKNIEYKYIEIKLGQPETSGTEYIDRDSFIEKFPVAKTVPQIVANGVQLGGFQNLKKYLEENHVSV